MNIFKYASSLVVAVALSAPVLASRLVVPDQYPDVTAALAAANPGDTILIRSTHTGESFWFIDKPIRIIAEEPGIVVSPTFGDEAIRLQGPGSGEVVLGNLTLFRGSGGVPGRPVFNASGFSKVSLYNVDMPRVPALEDPRTQVYGMDVAASVPYVLLSECLVEGYGPGTRQCNGFANNGVEAIHAPSSVVVLLDSVVRGSDGGFLCCDPLILTCPSSCPPTISPNFGGLGGDAIVCDELYQAGSVIQPGRGSLFEFRPTVGPPQICGAQPDGQKAVANVIVNMPNDLGITGSLTPGSTYTVDYDASGPITVLYIAFGTTPQPRWLSSGFGFADPNLTLQIGFVPPGPQSISLPVPPNPCFVGLEVLYQLLDSTDGLSRPVIRVISE